MPFSQEEWIANRMMLLNDVESWIAQAFRGGGLTTLLKKIQQHGGLDAFKRQWFNLVEKGYASSLVYYFELLL
jgi:hypothetical protein